MFRIRPSGTSPLLLFLVGTLVFLGLGQASFAVPRSAPPFRTANGITIQAGQTWPIFTFNAPNITPQNDTQPLGGLFSSIGRGSFIGQDGYRGLPRYTIPNTDTTSLLTQYSATGGFYAYHVNEIGGLTERGKIDVPTARKLACDFLKQNNFILADGSLVLGQFPQNAVTPNPQNCDPASIPTSYKTALIQGSGQNAQGGASDPITNLGIVVTVPISITEPSPGAPLLFPLGGPGGHISLLFRTTDAANQGSSLDSSVPGLAAVAMPFFGRTFTKLRDVPALDPNIVKQQVLNQVRASYGTQNVTVPDPTLFYMVGEAGEPQTALEPMLNFSGIEVNVGGETIILRDVMLPAVQSGSGAGGFGPSVNITSPPNGTSYLPGANVTLAGNIISGTAPYSYEWTLEDGTPLGAPGVLASTGPVTITVPITQGVVHGGDPGLVTVMLHVTDGEGAEREASVTLRPILPIGYLPLVGKNATSGTPASPAAAPVVVQPPTVINYRFGVEAAADYPPYGPGGSDLPGVPPDANGFRSRMLGYGWSQTFYWTNANVWEKDWRDCSLGGGDCTYGVDRVDFAYYSGHGGAGGLAVSRYDRDTSWAAAQNARFQNIRWAAFSSCQTLRVQGFTPPNEPIRRWFNAFQGAHMLLGFNSNMADVAFGGPLVDNMRIPTFFGIEFTWAQLTIRDAWVKTAFDMNAGKPAYIYATSASVNPVNNRLPKGSDALLPRPVPVNHFYWVWWE